MSQSDLPSPGAAGGANADAGDRAATAQPGSAATVQSATVPAAFGPTAPPYAGSSVPWPGSVPPAAPAPPPAQYSGQAPPPPVPPGYALPYRHEPRRSDTTWITGLILIAVGALALLGRYVPDAGQYIVLAIGLVLLVLFLVHREYGALVPGCILTGIGAGVPLAAANPGELGGALVLVSLGCGFIAIWALSLAFRLPERHWWPLVPGLVLGTIGAAMAAGERNQSVADVINVGWPAVLVVAGVLLLFGAVRRRA